MRHVRALGLLFALAVLALSPSAARAAEEFQKFTALLVDLPGWEAEKAEGMSMEMSGQKMVSAQRTYQKGDKQLDASIVWGFGAGAQMAPLGSGNGKDAMRIETSDGFLITESKDGHVVTTQYTRAEQTGAVMVMLDNSLMFVVNFQGLPFEEGQALAKKFNWQAIKAAAK